MSFKKALSLPTDSGSLSRVEVVLNFKRLAVAHAYDFSVFSIPEQGGSWQETAAAPSRPSSNREVRTMSLPTGRRSFASSPSWTLSRAPRNHASVQSRIDELYADMASKGNQFGPTFTMVQSAHLAESASISKVFVPDIAVSHAGSLHAATRHPSLRSLTH